MYPFLSLKNIPIDSELARRLPRQLAYYHLAIPIAEDDDSITVAMAMTNNLQVMRMLETVLAASIIPVRSHADEIKEALDAIWQQTYERNPSKLLAWGMSSEGALSEESEWVKPYAAAFAQVFESDITYLDSEQSALESALQIIAEANYTLIVTSDTRNLETLLTRFPAPILLVRGAMRPFQRVLFALRGHAPDRAALDYVLPLLKKHRTQVTLLSIAEPSTAGYVRISGIADLLSKDSNEGKHLANCTEILMAAKVDGNLKLRQGIPEQEIAAEIAANNYDLVVIAAEAYGDFVHHTLKAVDGHTPLNTSPILVIKYQGTRTASPVE